MSNNFNKWLEPYRRSFQSIKDKLLENLNTIRDSQDKPLITDKSEGNILVWILSQLSAIAEVLHYYIDRVGEETFLSTARKRDSLILHGFQVDYHQKLAIPAQVNVTLTRSYNNAQAKDLKKDTSVTDTQGNTWRLYKDYNFGKGDTLKEVTLIQCSGVNGKSFTKEDLLPDESGIYRYLPVSGFTDTNLYMEGSMNITIDGETWTFVESFAKYKYDDKVFTVTPYSETQVLVVFGDGEHGAVPNVNQMILCYFRYTLGGQGSISSEGINTTWPGDSTITVRNALPSSSGTSYETSESLRRRIPLSIKTLDVAITKQDFVDLAMTRPGVGQAEADYECGRKLTLYIADPEGNPVADSVIEDVQNYISQHCPMTTWFSVKSAGQTNIILDITVTGHKSYKSTYINDQIVQALLNKYSGANSKIGGSVRLSDIYALIDNLSSVDYLRINKFYLKPWPKTLNGTQLIIDTYELITCNVNMEYILEVNDGNITIYSKYNGYVGQSNNLEGISVIDDKNNNTFNMKFDQSSNIKSGYRYSIYITKNSIDYEEPGFNIPIFQESDLKLEINEIV